MSNLTYWTYIAEVSMCCLEVCKPCILDEIIITDSERLLTIMRVMNNKTFGFRFSEKVVGGRARLERLITQGLIRAEKGNKEAQNGKWLCNASDVLRYAKM